MNPVTARSLLLSAARRALLCVCGALALALTPASHAEPALLDGVAAIVNDDVVLLSELRNEVEMVQRQLMQTQNQAPPRDILVNQVMDRLILDKLQLAMGARAGVTITDGERNQALARIAERSGLTLEELYAQAQADGLSPSALREKIAQEMIISRVQQSVVNRRINVSNAEIEAFLGSEAAAQLVSAEEINVGHILLPLAPAANDAEVTAVREKAEALREKALQGEDFRQLAVAHSSGQNALEGGDLGWRTASQLPGAFMVALRNLDPGQITAPLRSDAGFHLLKLYGRRGGTDRVVRQSRVSHILIKPSEIRTEDQALEFAQTLRRRTISGEDFSTLAQDFSEDPGTALKGGDLGWALPGQFVPEFEAVMNATELDAVSEPFKTQFGWHILKITGRRDQDFSTEIRHNQAAAFLRQRKFEEELPIWLRELRDEAFVEIKL
ncbi:MAG: peptidylprolyl isomerase [Porticoccaceae bacterium]